MVSVRVSLNLKGSYKISPQETMAAGENRFAPELNEKKVIDYQISWERFQQKHFSTRACWI